MPDEKKGSLSNNAKIRKLEDIVYSRFNEIIGNIKSDNGLLDMVDSYKRKIKRNINWLIFPLWRDYRIERIYDNLDAIKGIDISDILEKTSIYMIDASNVIVTHERDLEKYKERIKNLGKERGEESNRLKEQLRLAIDNEKQIYSEMVEITKNADQSFQIIRDVMESKDDYESDEFKKKLGKVDDLKERQSDLIRRKKEAEDERKRVVEECRSLDGKYRDILEDLGKRCLFDSRMIKDSEDMKDRIEKIIKKAEDKKYERREFIKESERKLKEYGIMPRIEGAAKEDTTKNITTDTDTAIVQNPKEKADVDKENKQDTKKPGIRDKTTYIEENYEKDKKKKGKDYSNERDKTYKKERESFLSYLPVIGALTEKRSAVRYALENARSSAENNKIAGDTLDEIIYRSGSKNNATRKAIIRKLEKEGYGIEGKIESGYAVKSSLVDAINNIGISRYKIGNIGQGLKIYRGENGWDTFVRNTTIGGEVSAMIQATAIATMGLTIYQGISSSTQAIDDNIGTNLSGYVGLGLGIFALSNIANSNGITQIARSANSAATACSRYISKGIDNISKNKKKGFLGKISESLKRFAHVTQLASQVGMLAYSGYVAAETADNYIDSISETYRGPKATDTYIETKGTVPDVHEKTAEPTLTEDPTVKTTAEPKDTMDHESGITLEEHLKVKEELGLLNKELECTTQELVDVKEEYRQTKEELDVMKEQYNHTKDELDGLKDKHEKTIEDIEDIKSRLNTISNTTSDAALSTVPSTTSSIAPSTMTGIGTGTASGSAYTDTDEKIGKMYTRDASTDNQDIYSKVIQKDDLDEQINIITGGAGSRYGHEKILGDVTYNDDGSLKCGIIGGNIMVAGKEIPNDEIFLRYRNTETGENIIARPGQEVDFGHSMKGKVLDVQAVYGIERGEENIVKMNQIASWKFR